MLPVQNINSCRKFGVTFLTRHIRTKIMPAGCQRREKEMLFRNFLIESGR